MEKPVELELLDTLEDLADERLKYFHWYLQKVELLDGFPAIKKCHLENADRLKTVDVMVQIYSEHTMEVTRMILKKIKEGLGRTKRTTSNDEYPSNGSAGGAEGIYDLSIPAVVKFAYTAEREDELTLVKGSRVVIMEKCSNGWWRGSSGGHFGWFPSNYVLEENNSKAASVDPGHQRVGGAMVVSNNQSAGSSVLLTVRTLYPFSSVTEEELNFDKGEVMEVIEKPENDLEWWRCRNTDGLVGLVPKNYVVVLSDGPSLAFDKLTGKDWYFGKMTRHQATCELSERGVEGDFLVRCSESSPSDFSISMKVREEIKNFKVQLVVGVFCIGQKRFSSFDELVEHYKKVPIFTNKQGEKFYLVQPLTFCRDL